MTWLQVWGNQNVFSEPWVRTVALGLVEWGLELNVTRTILRWIKSLSFFNSSVVRYLEFTRIWVNTFAQAVHTYVLFHLCILFAILNRTINLFSIINCVDILWSLALSAGERLRRLGKATVFLNRLRLVKKILLIGKLPRNHWTLHTLLLTCMLRRLLYQMLIYINLLHLLHNGLIRILDNSDMPLLIHQTLSSLKPFHEVIIFLSFLFV